MSLLSVLQILADVTSSRSASSPRSTTSLNAQTPASNVQPPSWTPPAPFDATSAAPEDASPQLQTMQPVQPPQPTEASLRAQLDETDLYDLSGEKAAAEALQREDAFKEQQIQEKAQQTKEFFAEQDRKQQESFQEMQKQADAQLAEKSQKEFWDAKQAQETQAAMDKELNGLHEAARAEHQQWRAGFTQGVCHDDASALVNNQIEGRVEAYQDRLTDMGSNAVDAAANVEKYKVKLEDESSAEIASRAEELHKEHFPEYQGIAPAPPKPDGPLPGEIPSSGFGPFEAGPQGGYGLEDLVNKKGDFGPWEATAGPTPDKPFMRPMMDPRGDGTDAPEGWFKNVDELPKQDAPPGWFKNVDAPPADGKDIPDGFMKSIDPPVSEQAAAALKAAGSSAADGLSKAGDQAMEFGHGIKTSAEEWGGKVKDSAQVFGEKVQDSAMDFAHEVGTGAEKLVGKVKDSAEELGSKVKADAQELGAVMMTSAEAVRAKAATGAQQFGEMVKDAAGNLKYSYPSTLDQKVKETATPDTDEIKINKEVHTADVSAWAEKAKQRALEMGQTEAKAKADADHAATHAESVNQKMNPPTPPAATITTDTPAQTTPQVSLAKSTDAATPPATPATPATPAAPAAPATPAAPAAPTTPPVSLAKNSPS